MNREEFLELLKSKTEMNETYSQIMEAKYIQFYCYAEGYHSGAIQKEDVVFLIDDFLQLESNIISKILDSKEYYAGELDGKHSEVMGDVIIYFYKSCKEFKPIGLGIYGDYIEELLGEEWFSEHTARAFQEYRNKKNILKQNQLKAYWNQKENDIEVDYPLGQLTKCDANYLFSEVFTDKFEKEITARGYDITTLKFSIQVDKSGSRYHEKFPTLSKYNL